jgi:hypothetical protein
MHEELRKKVAVKSKKAQRYEERSLRDEIKDYLY